MIYHKYLNSNPKPNKNQNPKDNPPKNPTLQTPP